MGWHVKNKRKFQWRKTRDPYSILLAEIMLQRTKAEQVDRIYKKFFEKYPSVNEIAKATISSLQEDLKSLGLLKRAKYIKSLAKDLKTKFGGKIPEQANELLSLPMVGKYTANAVRCFAFSEDCEIVDSNVIRIIGRYYGFHDKSRKKMIGMVRNKVLQLIPHKKSQEFNWALLDLAALVCLPQQPKCKICPLRNHCAFSVSNVRN